MRKLRKILCLRRGDERGAILVMAAFGLVLAMVAAALAVDTGRLGAEKRRDQKVADLAALDAVREVNLGQAVQAARASATRNGFPWADTSAGYDLIVERGDVDASNNFTVNPSGGAVRVTAVSPLDNAFVSGNRLVQATAIAAQQSIGGFEIGSSLVTVDTSRSTLLNRTVGQMIGAPALNLSLVSWQGLASGGVTLSALQTELANMGFSVGTLNQLLDANLTAAQFFQAAAQAMTVAGDTANANVMNALQLAVTSSATFKLSEMIEVAQGGSAAALGSRFNLLQLVTGTAQVINGTNLISIPNAGVTLPGVSTTSLSLRVLEGPKWYFGPVGGSRSTGQVELTVNTDLNLNISVLGLAGARVTGSFPVNLTGAGAVGTLTSAVCSGGGAGITVNVDPTAFEGVLQASDLTVWANVILLGNIPVLRIPTTTATPFTDGGATDLFFSFPTEFPPPDGTETSKHAGSEPIGLNGLTNITTGSPVVLNALAAPLVGTIVGIVLSSLGTLLGNVDNSLLTPLLGILGVDVGGADVTALAVDCESPTLVG